MGTYCSYRFHANNIKENLASALQSYWDRLQLEPKSVAVNTRHTDQAQSFLVEIGLKVEVKGYGGCLINEVWLEV